MLFYFKATPHKEHLAILHVICLHIFRHLAQKSFDRRQPACMIFAQSDKKSDCASDAQSLCGVALTIRRNKNANKPRKSLTAFSRFAFRIHKQPKQ
jgi:hypothetical protein